MTEPRPRALTLIIAYKLGRAGFTLLAAITVVILRAAGVTAHLGQVMHEVHAHAVTEISLSVSAAALSVLEPKHIWVVVGALFLDAAMVFVEGWALLKNWAWASWLVVVASSLALPFEVVAIARHLSWPRVVLFVLNVAIVAYLLVRALRHHRARQAAGKPLATTPPLQPEGRAPSGSEG